MKIKICHSKQGTLFDGDVAKVEVIEQDKRIRYILTGWDNKERDIVSENQYTVLRIGSSERAQKAKGYLGDMVTTWDLASDFDRAIQTLKDANVDTDNLIFWLPGPNGFLTKYGPCSPEEAYEKCTEYWNKTAFWKLAGLEGKDDGKTD